MRDQEECVDMFAEPIRDQQVNTTGQIQHLLDIF